MEWGAEMRMGNVPILVEKKEVFMKRSVFGFSVGE